MKSAQLGRYLMGAVAAAALTLGMSGTAHALFPPPFYYPASTAGETVPPDPPTVPDPFVPPPCECCCTPTPCGGGTGVATTPEPTTMISSAIGLTVLAGFVWRRRNPK